MLKKGLANIMVIAWSRDPHTGYWHSSDVEP